MWERFVRRTYGGEVIQAATGEEKIPRVLGGLVRLGSRSG